MASPEPEKRKLEDEANPADAPSPGSVLDSVFSSDGPMPPASIWLRAFAFLLDFVLVAAVASILIWKIVLPQSHPAAFAELTEWTSAVMKLA